MPCKDCGSAMTGDGYTRPLTCESIEDPPRDLEPDAPPLYCGHQDPPSTTCEGCGKEIDPDCCGCGDGREHHGNPTDAGHSFIPMGCDCFRSKEPS